MRFTKTFLSTTALAAAFFIAPTAYAASSMVHMDTKGNIWVSGLQVTSVTGSTLTGNLVFPNSQTPVIVATHASTTIKTNPTGNSGVSNITSIKIGDMLNLSGVLTGINSSITLTANKIKNTTTLGMWKTKSGTVQSVNTTNGSFVLTTSGKKQNSSTVTVQTNATTVFHLSNKATSTFNGVVTTNANVHVVGTLSADGTVLTATKVVVKNSVNKVSDKENKKEKTDRTHFGWWNGKHNR